MATSHHQPDHYFYPYYRHKNHPNSGNSPPAGPTGRGATELRAQGLGPQKGPPGAPRDHPEPAELVKSVNDRAVDGDFLVIHGDIKKKMVINSG